MNNLLLSMLAALATTPVCFSQTNFPFPKVSAEWVVYKVYGIIGPNDDFIVYRDFLEGDSVFLGKTYSIAYRQNLCQCICPQPGTYVPQTNQNQYVLGGVREENGKVYFTKFGAGTGQSYFQPATDTLLFDFTAQAGDTINYANNTRLAITEIDTAPDGRKNIHFKILPIGYPRIWREGIGCEGLLETTEWFNLNFNEGCFSDVLPGSCTYPCSLTTGLTVREKIVGLEVFPSTTTDRVAVILPERWNSADVWLFTSDGVQIGNQTNLTSGATVDFTNAPPGVVLMYFIGSDGRKGTVRVVKI